MHLRRNQFLIKAPKGAQSIKLSLVDERQEEVSQISESDFCRRRKWEFSIWSALPPRTSISAPPSCMLGKRQHNLRKGCVWLQNIALFGCSNGPRLTFFKKINDIFQISVRDRLRCMCRQWECHCCHPHRWPLVFSNRPQRRFPRLQEVQDCGRSEDHPRCCPPTWWCSTCTARRGTPTAPSLRFSPFPSLAPTPKCQQISSIKVKEIWIQIKMCWCLWY